VGIPIPCVYPHSFWCLRKEHRFQEKLIMTILQEAQSRLKSLETIQKNGLKAIDESIRLLMRSIPKQVLSMSVDQFLAEYRYQGVSYLLFNVYFFCDSV
jgi:parvulin-like peptidyl-prolyl isomerase